MRRWGWWTVVRVVALVLLAIQAAYYAYDENREQEALRRLVQERIGTTRDEDEALVKTTALAFHIPPHKGVDVHYGLVNPLMKVLRPSALKVYEHGGHCAKRSRLLVELLEAQGIEAHKLYLYNPLGLQLLKDPPRAWVHVVVEADVSGRRVVADPLFDIVFRNPDGVLATQAELARDTTLLRSWRQKADERFDGWEDKLYFYDDVRRLPWFMLPKVGEPLRAALVRVLGEPRVDAWTEPDWMEHPQLQIVWISLILMVLIGLTFRPRRRTVAPIATPASRYRI